jgi:hypothetical protein
VRGLGPQFAVEHQLETALVAASGLAKSNTAGIPPIMGPIDRQVFHGGDLKQSARDAGDARVNCVCPVQSQGNACVDPNVLVIRTGRIVNESESADQLAASSTEAWCTVTTAPASALTCVVPS